MKLETFVGKYGNEAVRELLNLKIILGTNSNSYAEYLKYAKKYGMCGKGTGLARPNFFTNYEHWGYTGEGRERQHVRLAEAIMVHNFRLLNGRSQHIMHLEMTDAEYKHYTGE